VARLSPSLSPSLSPNDQLDQLRRMAAGRRSDWLKYGLLLLAAALALAALLTLHPVFGMVLVFVAVVSYSAWQSTPHMDAAAVALRFDHRSTGTVQITVGNWSGSDSYQATVQGGARTGDAPARWRFEFIPLGWRPVAGRYTAVLFAHPALEWPALIQTEQGIIYPRYKPERVAN
jgi:hypothetical protein